MVRGLRGCRARGGAGLEAVRDLTQCVASGGATDSPTRPKDTVQEAAG